MTLTITLDEDYNALCGTHADEERLRAAIIRDLSTSLHANASRFEIKDVKPGSIVITILVHPDPLAQDPRSSQQLAAQVFLCESVSVWGGGCLHTLFFHTLFFLCFALFFLCFGPGALRSSLRRFVCVDVCRRVHTIYPHFLSTQTLTLAARVCYTHSHSQTDTHTFTHTHTHTHSHTHTYKHTHTQTQVTALANDPSSILRNKPALRAISKIESGDGQLTAAAAPIRDRWV